MWNIVMTKTLHYSHVLQGLQARRGGRVRNLGKATVTASSNAAPLTAA
jgi:hypothetical protein